MNSLGNVFEGRNAPQAAVDDLLSNTDPPGAGKVWLGRSAGTTSDGHYGPLDVRYGAGEVGRMVVEGLGAATTLDGGVTAPAIEVENTAGDATGTARFVIRDVGLRTDSAGTQPGLKYTNAVEQFASGIHGSEFGGPAVHFEGWRNFYLANFYFEGMDQSQGMLVTDRPGGATPDVTVTNGTVSANTCFRFDSRYGHTTAFRSSFTNVNLVTDFDTPWVVSDGNVSRSLMDGISGVGGGTSLRPGDDLTIGTTS